jgi:hypothetical protein
MDFERLIRDETVKIESLHAEVHRTVVLRDRDASHRRAWEQACHAFHTYSSPLDAYFEQACDAEKYSDRKLIEFAICFLEVDPIFFRSGYLKQIVITRLKRSELREGDKSRLRGVVWDAVNRRGTREFKYYCRLAAILADDTLLKQLKAATLEGDPSRASRASLMLEQVTQSLRKHTKPLKSDARKNSRAS